MKKLIFVRWKFTSLVLIILTIILIALPVRGAQRIYLNTGSFNLSISVKALETFATEGKIETELAFILNLLSSQQQTQLRDFLRTRYEISQVKLYQLGNSYAGDQLLTLVGNAVQIPQGQNGYYALRGAILHAAATPEGVSVINVLRNFATDVELNVNYILASFQRISSLIKETEAFMEYVKKINSIELASKSQIESQVWVKLLNRGDFTTFKQIFTLQDSKRNRSIKTFFYLPQTELQDLPLIFISGGLGSDGEHFNVLAEHLASYGFAVIIPEHPNSNGQRQADFYEGFYKDPFDALEFVDRPLDITFILNYLEQVNSTQFKGQLNLKRVGFFGFSFGGTTGLALGGAQINFQQLDKDCNPPDSLINISILYQCRALEIPRQNYQLQDKRIQAIFAFVPFGKSLYGAAEIAHVTIPTFWQVTSEDVITPLLIEQVPVFSWLPKQNKYLIISEKLPHSQIVINSLNSLTNQKISAQKVEQVEQDYLNALSLAFFKVYIAQDKAYLPFLEPNYITNLSESPFNLLSVKNLELNETFPILNQQLK